MEINQHSQMEGRTSSIFSLVTVNNATYLEQMRCYLRDGFDMHSRNDSGLTLFDLAIIAGNWQIVDLLLEFGLNINEITARTCIGISDINVTALHLAAASHSELSIRNLLDRGANANALTESGCTALHFLACPRRKVFGKKKIKMSMPTFVTGAHLLLQHGADPCLKCTRAVVINGRNFPVGSTALHMCDNYEVAEAVLRHGANVLEEDEEGNTALHCAAAARNLEMVAALISHGAESTRTNRAGESPLHCYQANRHIETKFTQSQDLFLDVFLGAVDAVSAGSLLINAEQVRSKPHLVIALLVLGADISEELLAEASEEDREHYRAAMATASPGLK